jgi:uncharacterized protein (TIGR02145 family)
MKKLYVLSAMLLVSAISFSQAPAGMSYQAVVRDVNGALLVGRNVGMQISILSGSVEGTAVYKEKRGLITNTNGLVTLEIGTGSTSDTFATIDWSSGLYFIKTEIDPTGGSNYSITGTSQLMSVPYALQSKKADNGITSNQAADITANKAKLEQASGISSGDMQYWDGTSWVLILSPNVAAALQIIGGVPTWVGGTKQPLMIGTQIWTDKNLDLKQYTDGTYIPEVKNVNDWYNLKTGAWCHFDNNAASDLYLYNWYAVMGIATAESAEPTATEIAARKQLAPIGFHIPTDDEWTTLTNFLGEQIPTGIIARKMKAVGCCFGGNNSSGFTGLPAGMREMWGSYIGVNQSGYWWSSTQDNTGRAIGRALYTNFDKMESTTFNKTYGLSVRCIKD